MHVALQFFQPFLVLDAEMLLLVDDQQAETLELNGIGEERMRADNNIDLAFRQLFLGLVQLFRGHQA